LAGSTATSPTSIPGPGAILAPAKGALTGLSPTPGGGVAEADSIKFNLLGGMQVVEWWGGLWVAQVMVAEWFVVLV